MTIHGLMLSSLQVVAVPCCKRGSSQNACVISYNALRHSYGSMPVTPVAGAMVVVPGVIVLKQCGAIKG